MIYRNLATIAVLGLMAVSACKKDSTIPADPYFRNYFPAEVGSYIIYDCDSIVYDDFNGTVDTFRFQIKEHYKSSFVDNSGRNALRIERWKKPADTLSWFLKDVWYVVASDNQIEKVEEDVRYIKLSFPVKEARRWDINALNSLGSRTVNYKDVHQNYAVAGVSYDSTVTVVNTDPENLVSEYRNTEIFAAKKGMIYKQYVDVDFVVPTPVIESGVVFTMRAIEFGTE